MPYVRNCMYIYIYVCTIYLDLCLYLYMHTLYSIKWRPDGRSYDGQWRMGLQHGEPPRRRGSGFRGLGFRA